MGGPGWSMFAYQYEYSVELWNVSKRAHGRGHHPSLVVNWDGASSTWPRTKSAISAQQEEDDLRA